MKMSEADNPTSATSGSATNSDSEHASSKSQSGNVCDKFVGTIIISAIDSIFSAFNLDIVVY